MPEIGLRLKMLYSIKKEKLKIAKQQKEGALLNRYAIKDLMQVNQTGKTYKVQDLQEPKSKLQIKFIGKYDIMIHEVNMIDQLQRSQSEFIGSKIRHLDTNSTQLPKVREMGIYFTKSKNSMKLKRGADGKLVQDDGSSVPADENVSFFYISN